MKSGTFFGAAVLWIGIASVALAAPVLQVGDVSTPLPNTLLPINLHTDVPVAAIQFDVLYDATTLTIGIPQAGTAFVDHVVTSSGLAAGDERVVVHSLTNAALGSDVLIQIPVTPTTPDQPDPTLMLTNLVLSGPDGAALTPQIAPTVRLLGLTDRGQVNGQGGLHFTATATTSEQNDAISKVEYYADGLLVGQSTTGDYGFTWTPPGSGTFKINAVAYDSDGLMASSRTISVVVVGLGTTPVSALYVGLVEEDEPIPATSGMVTLKTTPTGAFSGKFTLGGTPYALAGKFDANGEASKTLSTSSHTTLTVTLQIDAVPQKNEITGTVSDGTFTSNLVADHAPWNGKKTKAPWAGKYTLALPANPSDTDSTIPQGSGVATVQVSALGTVHVAGNLADGTPFMQGTSLSQEGSWPFFIPLKKGAGMVIGPLQFEDITDLSDLDGSLTWSHPASVAGLFKTAFAETLAAIGSTYKAPVKGVRALALPNLAGNAEFTADDGSTATLNKIVTLSSANTLAPIGVGSDKLKLTLAAGTGGLAGSFVPAAGSPKATVKGVLLQKQNMGVGYYLSSAASGAVSLTDNPAYGDVPVEGGAHNDHTAPLLAIKSPAANAKFTSPAAITFSGTASDRAGVAKVQYQVLSGGTLSPVETASGTTTWTATITPATAGTYTVFVKAVDIDGNETGLTSRKFIYLDPTGSTP